jgi:hypothetical protein
MKIGLPLIVLLTVLGAPVHAGELRAGAAQTDITPPIGFPMWGYAARHDKPSQGVLDPLRARALVLATDQERIALVSLDLGRPPTRQSTEAIRKRVESAGIHHLFLVASHTHHGPVLELDTWPTPQESYVRRLEQKIADVILEAAGRLRPARLGVAAAESRLNRNRHSKLPNPPVDRQLLVLRVEDRDGKPIAHAVNFAAHAVLRPSGLLKFSADYPGPLADLLEKETGAPCLFLQGAAGDLSPGTEGDDRTPERFGELLGREALALLKDLRCPAGTGTNPQVQEEDFRFPCRVDLGNAAIRFAMGRAFFPDLIAFYEREYREGVHPHLTVALLDGRLGFVGVSGEFFCGHALSLKRRARLDHVFFLGYCNDYHQYFPTIEAASEGGYGTDPLMAPAALGAGERIMDRALIHLYRMRGQLPAREE